MQVVLEIQQFVVLEIQQFFSMTVIGQDRGFQQYIWHQTLSMLFIGGKEKFVWNSNQIRSYKLNYGLRVFNGRGSWVTELRVEDGGGF